MNFSIYKNLVVAKPSSPKYVIMHSNVVNPNNTCTRMVLRWSYNMKSLELKNFKSYNKYVNGLTANPLLLTWWFDNSLENVSYSSVKNGKITIC